jgi:hypothetical protein
MVQLSKYFPKTLVFLVRNVSDCSKKLSKNFPKNFGLLGGGRNVSDCSKKLSKNFPKTFQKLSKKLSKNFPKNFPKTLVFLVRNVTD